MARNYSVEKFDFEVVMIECKNGNEIESVFAKQKDGNEEFYFTPSLFNEWKKDNLKIKIEMVEVKNCFDAVKVVNSLNKIMEAKKIASLGDEVED